MELEGAVGVVAGVGFVDEEEAGDDEAPGSHFGRSRRPRWGCLGGGADDGEKTAMKWKLRVRRCVLDTRPPS